MRHRFDAIGPVYAEVARTLSRGKLPFEFTAEPNGWCITVSIHTYADFPNCKFSIPSEDALRWAAQLYAAVEDSAREHQSKAASAAARMAESRQEEAEEDPPC